jgi:hypothetical protein
MASALVSPAANLRRYQARPSVSWRSWEAAAMWIMWFIRRFPARESRRGRDLRHGGRSRVGRDWGGNGAGLRKLLDAVFA